VGRDPETQRRAFAYQNRLSELMRTGTPFQQARAIAIQETGYAHQLPDPWGTEAAETVALQEQAFAYQNRLAELTAGGFSFIQAQLTARQETGYVHATPDRWGTETAEAVAKQKQAFAYQNRVRELMREGYSLLKAQMTAKQETGYRD
jgi:hypothetical protein